MIPAEILNTALVRSTNYLITVFFAQSRSKNFEAALNIAMQANHFEEVTVGNSKFYLASFGITLPQSSLALLLMDFVNNWKGSHIFLKGVPLRNSYNIISTLECFQNSMRCSNSQAHCHTIQKMIGETANPQSTSFSINIKVEHFLDKILPKEEVKEEVKWIHPCRKISYYLRELNSQHSASLQDQLQAQAVSHGCDICPNFKPSDLRKI